MVESGAVTGKRGSTSLGLQDWARKTNTTETADKVFNTGQCQRMAPKYLKKAEVVKLLINMLHLQKTTRCRFDKAKQRCEKTSGLSVFNNPADTDSMNSGAGGS